MTSHALFQRLVDAQLFEETADAVRLTDRYRQSVPGAADRSAVDEGDSVPEDTALEGLPEGLWGALTPPVRAELLAAAELASEVDPGSLVALLPRVDSLYRPPERGGSPDAFTPVNADVLPAVLAAAAPSVVYAWKRDCPPCDVMRESLAECFRGDERPVQLFSVYGPADPATLSDYQIEGAPTTLFTAEGRVQGRILGERDPAVVEAELESVFPDLQPRGRP